ncbi:MAG: toll/interleukin-1 receptor domain-containing protein, partial [Solirubrobacterales bacterium]|nr:toll/interleukin-1 receptor domain-containing protein [Solirubrobacterales bacterium]
MTAVFISYSRRDQGFVKRLHDALKSRQYEVWVDWEDIPPS